MMLCRTTKDVRISCRTQQRPHSSIAVAARASAVLRGSLISFTSVCLRVSLFLLCVCITARDIAIVFFFFWFGLLRGLKADKYRSPVKDARHIIARSSISGRRRRSSLLLINIFIFLAGDLTLFFWSTTSHSFRRVNLEYISHNHTEFVFCNISNLVIFNFVEFFFVSFLVTIVFNRGIAHRQVTKLFRNL